MLVLFAYVDYFLYLCRKYRLVSVDVGENRLVSKKDVYRNCGKYWSR